MNCKELAYLLADYLDGTMNPRMQAELDEHISLCEPCRIFVRTYRTTCKKAVELRRSIRYEIPDEVRERMAAVLVSAARKFPREMEAYRRQSDEERRAKACAFCRAALEKKLSSVSSLLVEGHVCGCPKCREYFVVLEQTHAVPRQPPPEILEHLIRLLQSLPPGEEFFLD